MIALKKIILAFALLAVMFCIAGCDENFDEPGSGYDGSFGEPIVTLTINDSKKNAEEDIQIFDNLSERERFAYLHYYIDGEASEYNLRIRTEISRGEDDYNVGENFKTLSDEMVTEKSGKWQHNDIFFIVHRSSPRFRLFERFFICFSCCCWKSSSFLALSTGSRSAGFLSMK